MEIKCLKLDSVGIQTFKVYSHENCFDVISSLELWLCKALMKTMLVLNIRLGLHSLIFKGQEVVLKNSKFRVLLC